MLVKGCIERLVQRITEDYPGFLDERPDIMFMLDCVHFVQLSTMMLPNQDPTIFESLLKVGQRLETQEHDMSDNLKQLARDSLAIIAYKQPEQSPMAYLLSPSHKANLALTLEVALLTKDNLSPYSKLERLLRAVFTNLEYLKELGSDATAFTDSCSSAVQKVSLKYE